jgi:hypothetical protein
MRRVAQLDFALLDPHFHAWPRVVAARHLETSAADLELGNLHRELPLGIVLDLETRSPRFEVDGHLGSGGAIDAKPAARSDHDP